MNPVLSFIGFLIWIFFLAMIGRLIFDWIQVFSRDWRPRGVVLLAVEGIYSVTDPPLKALRRVIPPLRIGGISLDLAFMLLFFIVVILLSLFPV